MSSPLRCSAGSFADLGAVSCTPCSASGVDSVQCALQVVSSPLELGAIIGICALFDFIGAFMIFRRVAKESTSLSKPVLWAASAVIFGPLVWFVWCCRRRAHDQPAMREPLLGDAAQSNTSLHAAYPTFSTPFDKFDHHYTAASTPKFADELLGAVRKVIAKFCEKNQVGSEVSVKFFKDLEKQAFTHAQDLTESISASAGFIWTSQLLLKLPGGRDMEFCAILNRILRDLDDDLLPDACIIVHAINALCVLRRDPSKLMFPPGGVSYRGGGLPLQHVVRLPGHPPPFFVPGKKYRVPMFLATSFELYVAQNFSVMAAQHGYPPVIWTVKVDPRGESQLLHRCKHVNQVTKSNVGGESEFLYAPYSVFTIESVTLPPAGAAPTPHFPIRIVLMAALDNQAESKLLPLAPWA
jgi:hypothetical protein